MSTGSPPFLDKVMDLLIDTVCVVDSEGNFVFVSAACEGLLGYTPEELIGRNMLELVHPQDRDRTLAAAKKVMLGQPHTHFENRYVRKDGRVVDIMWSARWSEADGLRLAVARDVSALKHAARVQSILLRISEAAHAAEGLPALCAHIHQILGDLFPADSFFVALHDAGEGMLSFPYAAGERSAGTAPQPLDNASPLAEVIRTGQALLRASAGSGVDWLGVPLVSHKGVIGALVLQSAPGAAGYAEEDKELLHFISTQVATAIERKQAESRLRRMARYDPLTDLANRMLFQDRFEMALKRARRDGEHLALLYLDLDGFKDVNDSYGHVVGDRLLREVAQRLSECVRGSDTIGRMGGDEFTVLLINTDDEHCAELVGEKIRAALSEPFELDGRMLSISASIGTALFPEHGSEREQLLHHADASMYAAKRGRA